MSQKPKTTGKAKSFTIDRGKWLQGGVLKRTYKVSVLKDHGGNMCCLGFYSEACGATGLRGTATPGELHATQTKKLDHRIVDKFGDNTLLAHHLMGINDNEDTRNKIREDRVKRAFAKLGITVKFKGKYPYDPKVI